MPDTQHLILFVLAGWLLNLTPGPDVLYIVSHSLRSGARAGVVAALGITAGCFVHVFAAAAGVSALLAASATAFTVLKWVGAGYLVWVGLRILLSRTVPSVPGANEQAGKVDAGAWAIFRGGFLTNVLNPKVAIFFLAFVPQFIPEGSTHPSLSFLLLGVLFNFNAVPVNAGWALAAAWLARRQSVQQGMAWLDRAAACMFLGFGIRLALTDNPTR